MSILREVCRVTGATAADLIGTEIEDLDTGPGDETVAPSELDKTEQDTTAEAVGEDNTRLPSCRFHSCFGCDKGHCTVLSDNDFGVQRCPFYKSREAIRHQRQDELDRLLIDGRHDLINRYESTYIDLGLIQEEPDNLGLDEATRLAREQFAEFEKELEAGSSRSDTTDDYDWDDEAEVGADTEEGDTDGT